MLRWLGWSEAGTAVPTMGDLAAAERRYAQECRRIAEALGPFDGDEAAVLQLEADMCDLWADELERGDGFASREYAAALDELHAARAGQVEPRGGIMFLLEEEQAHECA